MRMEMCVSTVCIEQLYLATRPADVNVGRERYALYFLPELITKPQPPLEQRNQ